MSHRVDFRRKLGKDSGDFSATDLNVVGPFNFCLEAGSVLNRSHQGNGRRNRDTRGGLGLHLRTEQERKPESLSGTRLPFSTQAAPSFGL